MTLCDISSAGSIETIAAVATAGATAVAAIVTAWMAYETKRMAHVAMRTIEFEHTPILGIRDVRVGISPSGPMQINGSQSTFTSITSVQVAIELYNAGRVPLSYRMRSLGLTFAGRIGDASNYLSMGGTVLPGCSTFFWYTPLTLDPPIGNFPSKGRIRGVVEYWHTDESKPRELRIHLEYVIAGANPGSPTNWLFIDGNPDA